MISGKNFLFALLRIFGLLDFVTEENVNRTFSAHHGNLTCRPGEGHVSTHLTRVHGEVSAAVGLAGND